MFAKNIVELPKSNMLASSSAELNVFLCAVQRFMILNMATWQINWNERRLETIQNQNKTNIKYKYRMPNAISHETRGAIHNYSCQPMTTQGL